MEIETAEIQREIRHIDQQIAELQLRRFGLQCKVVGIELAQNLKRSLAQTGAATPLLADLLSANQAGFESDFLRQTY